jgi:hypothetical protein
MRVRGLTLPLSINFALRPVPTRLKCGLSTPIARDGAGEVMAAISRLPCGICTNPMIFAFSISTLSGLHLFRLKELATPVMFERDEGS